MHLSQPGNYCLLFIVKENAHCIQVIKPTNVALQTNDFWISQKTQKMHDQLIIMEKTTVGLLHIQSFLSGR